MKTTISVLTIFLGFFALTFVCAAQTIQVDITPGHATNHFAPNQALGAGVDRIAQEAIDKDLVQPALDRALSSWLAACYLSAEHRIVVEAWHWNPQGTVERSGGQGYFTGATTRRNLSAFVWVSTAPSRGHSQPDGNGIFAAHRRRSEYVLEEQSISHEDVYGRRRSSHPQWVVLDLATPQQINAIRIHGLTPYAALPGAILDRVRMPIHAADAGAWKTFSGGDIANGNGRHRRRFGFRGSDAVRFIRIWMTESSNTCDTHGSGDPRNCVGYAIREVYLGTTTADGLSRRGAAHG